MSTASETLKLSNYVTLDSLLAEAKPYRCALGARRWAKLKRLLKRKLRNCNIRITYANG